MANPSAAEASTTARPPIQVDRSSTADNSDVPQPPEAETRPTRRYGLDVLRILAICGVVAIHVVGIIVAKDELRGTRSWWIATAIDLGAVWTVPLFVMISGALTLAPRAHAEGPGPFYRKRFARILPALVAWHLIYLVGVRVLMQGQELTLRGVIQNLIDARVYTALYFLWLIAGLYVIAPVLAAFLRDGGRRRAMVFAGVALAFTLASFVAAGVSGRLGAPRPIHLGALAMWWPYVGYFLAGWALVTVRLSARWMVLAAVLATALLVEGVWQWGVSPAHPVLQTLFPISYVGTTVAIATLCLFVVGVNLGDRITLSPRPARLLVRLSEASFGVFLVHLLIFAVIRLTVPAVARGESLTVMLLAYVVVLVTSFAVAVGAARVPYLRTIF
jgi:surface polysaccharide O-acyltransferase-like enzyme